MHHLYKGGSGCLLMTQDLQGAGIMDLDVAEQLYDLQGAEALDLDVAEQLQDLQGAGVLDLDVAETCRGLESRTWVWRSDSKLIGAALRRRWR